jgi:AcrR family transcriptional regulator
VSDTIEIQRVRLLAAMIETAAVHGYAEAGVAEVCMRAGVARRAFHELYADREDCFLAAFDDIVARGCVCIVDACRETEEWTETIKAGLSALLAFFDEQPLAARFVALETFTVSTRVLWRRSRLLDRFAEVVHAGGCAAFAPADRSRSAPSRDIARELVVKAHSIVFEGVVYGRSGELTSLAAPLASMIVLPYVGEAAARRELAQAGSASSG